MIRIVLLGYGNAGSHLAKVFNENTSVKLVQVYNRSIENIKHLERECLITANVNELLEADVYIISISDDEISKFSKSLNLKNKLVVHTSGSIDMKMLSSKRKGVFYPLQTFTKNISVNFKKIPICIEATNNTDLILLEKLASTISDNTYILDSEQRKKMHLSAVFVNNFVNHLYQIGHTICEENAVPFEILHPLMEETFNKIKSIKPLDAQTGPAKRNDQEIIKRQLAQLSEEQQKLYISLTNSIIKTYS